MSEARQQVLEMLRAGKISADEAMELLDALADAPATVRMDSGADATAVYQPAAPDPYPDADRFRQYWRWPFTIGLFVSLFVALWLRTVYQNAAGAFTFGLFCLTSVFILVFSLTLLAFASRRSTWLHVRVQEQSGTRVNISLPLPLSMAKWGLRIGRGFAPTAVADQLDIADAFLQTAADELRGHDAEPIVIHVDEGDGDQVYVYFG